MSKKLAIKACSDCKARFQPEHPSEKFCEPCMNKDLCDCGGQISKGECDCDGLRESVEDGLRASGTEGRD
jgi:hypothetical protein